MATTTAPMMKVKSHQLHNFPVSLKWGQPTTVASAATSVAGDYETESEPERRTRSRSARNHRFCFTLLSNSPEKVPVFEPNPPPNRERESEHRHQEQLSMEKEENNFRPWKLRPRKEAQVVLNHDQQREKESLFQQPKSARSRGMVEGSSNGGGGERDEGCVEKKRKFWIALSKEEIEEDVFIMTGSRPSRRPKKRPKNVQKVLDTAFPGLWLVGASVDSYRVTEPPVKRLI